MKKLSLLILSLFLFSAATISARRLVLIKHVGIQDKSLVLKHNSQGDIKFKKRIYDSPPRLVFDVLDADLEGTKKTFLIHNSDVKEIRVGQFEPTVVRVVMQAKNLSALEKIKIENVGQGIYFRFAVKDIVIRDFKFADGNLIIHGSGKINHRKIFLENPKRLVVDLLGAKIANSELKKTFKNGEEEIRTGQFDKSIVRIVFSGPKSHEREKNFIEGENTLTIEGEAAEVEEIAEGGSKKRGSLKDKIEAIKLISSRDEKTVYRISASKPLKYKVLKLHKPERLVVDLLNIAFEESLMAEQFKETPHVKDVRFGLATIGTPVTRVVFDLKSSDMRTEFELSSDEERLDIEIIGDGEVDPTIPKAQKGYGKKVVIDPGHGGYDPGAMHGGEKEKDITLDISKKLKKYLDRAGIQAYLSRSNDRFISLAERVEISNSIAPAIFVSVHVNALKTNSSMAGLQTYYYSSAGYKIASVVHKQLLEDIKMRNGNIRKARFWVTKYTHAPSILCELGFMTNAAERKKLASKSYQDDLAKSLARGIIKYLDK